MLTATTVNVNTLRSSRLYPRSLVVSLARWRQAVARGATLQFMRSSSAASAAPLPVKVKTGFHC